LNPCSRCGTRVYAVLYKIVTVLGTVNDNRDQNLTIPVLRSSSKSALTCLISTSRYFALTALRISYRLF
jgi:hypothetical protein